METGKRNELMQKIYAVQRLTQDFKRIGEYVKKYLGANILDDFFRHLGDLEKILSEEREKIPVGHLYHGTYYVKKPSYMLKPDDQIFEKRNGPIFMSERLVSWSPGKNQSYIRYIYKDADLTQLVRREDGEAIYTIPDSFQ